MRSILLFLGMMFLSWSPLLVSSDSSDDKCADTTSFQCPHLSDLCNETVYVENCLDCKGYMSTNTNHDVCFDRKLLNGKDNPDKSYLWRDIIGILVWFCAAGVATACGVGGGGIYVPLGILLLNFAPKPSSGLSQASIFGASLGGLVLNIRNKHPFTAKVVSGSTGNGATSILTTDEHPESSDHEKYYSRPLIDFDMALFLAPMEMAGAVLGVLIQKILPNWLYLTLAAIILSYTAKKTYSKFFDTREKERAAYEAREAEQQSQGQETAKEDSCKNLDGAIEKTAEMSAEQGQSQTPASQEQHMDLQATTEEEEEPHTSAETSAEESEDNEMTEVGRLARRQYWLEQDSRQYPTEKLMALFILWIGLVLLTFFKGGKGVDSIVGITCASPWYAVLIATQFAWTLGISAFFGCKIMKQTDDKQACGYPWHPQDVFWDFEKVRFYAFFTFVAGVVAGLIGIGGGMVLGPLMLVMGIHPRVSSATTATMIVLTSSSVAILFVTAGLVPWQYALTFFCVCLAGAYVGKTKIDSYVKRTGKASLLILLLATIIALATLGCVVIVLTRLATADWCFAGFNKFCTVSEDDNEGDLCPVDRMLFGMPFIK